MLRVDVQNLSEKQLRKTVESTCARYGKVTQVEVCYDRLSEFARPFALVYMETVAESCKLAAAFGGRIVGPSVLIPLRPSRGEPGGLSRIR